MINLYFDRFDFANIDSSISRPFKDGGVLLRLGTTGILWELNLDTLLSLFWRNELVEFLDC